MKIELSNKRPENFTAYWEGQYEVFHHFEFACGIPSVLFAISTVKENGQPNVCLHAWSSFVGEGDGYFAVLGGVAKHSHTYQNILRTGEFAVNFLSAAQYDALIRTIHANSAEADEFEAGGFLREDAVTISCPRIAEAFLCLECALEKQVDLTEQGKTSVLIGRVRHVALEEAYATEILPGDAGEKYGERGFMFNLHAPKNLRTGEGERSGVATLQMIRTDM